MSREYELPEIVVAPARGSVAMNDVAIDQCEDPAFLVDVLGCWHDSLAGWFAHDEWPLADEQAQRVACDYLARMGRVLARLTELLERPPTPIRDRALNVRALRQADDALAEARRRYLHALPSDSKAPEPLQLLVSRSEGA